MLHQGFANRFFPGTSVLQTRLRYALFVPWQINDQLSARAASGELAEEGLKRAEQRLVYRLQRGTEKDPAPAKGIIGSRSTKQDPDQPPSTIYWTALRKWQILQPRDGRAPSRSAVLASHLSDDDTSDEKEEAAMSGAFYALPDPPANWTPPKGTRIDKAPGLTFRLEGRERKYLRDRLREVKQEVDTTRPLSLLARLADSKPVPGQSWRRIDFDAPRVRRLARDGDEDVIEVAAQASSLTKIGRAAYTALIQHVAEVEDRRSRSDAQYKDLESVISQEGARARNLRLSDVQKSIGPLDPTFYRALDATLQWLKTGKRRIEDLLETYRASEVDRKDDRARLARFPNAPGSRKAWLEDAEREASGLNYRWHRVGWLLDDLHDFR